MTFLVVQMVKKKTKNKQKKTACNAGDLGLIPKMGRSSAEGNGYPIQYSCLEILWREESGRLQSTGLQTAGHD